MRSCCARKFACSHCSQCLGVLDRSVLVDARREVQRADSLREVPYALDRGRELRASRLQPGVRHLRDIPDLLDRHPVSSERKLFRDAGGIAPVVWANRFLFHFVQHPRSHHRDGNVAEKFSLGLKAREVVAITKPGQQIDVESPSGGSY